MLSISLIYHKKATEWGSNAIKDNETKIFCIFKLKSIENCGLVFDQFLLDRIF
jgi:hypothetical protein